MFHLALMVVAIGGCAEKQNARNVCPIDGRPPEWSKQVDARNCEYFHFNAIERQTHSWTAPCEQNTLQ
jgi:hypothetical protein